MKVTEWIEPPEDDEEDWYEDDSWQDRMYEERMGK